MKKRKLNVKLLRKIQRHITEEPRRFFMDGYMREAMDEKDWRDYVSYTPDLSKTMPPCKTAACIAGWANILSGNNGWLNGLEDAAAEIGLLGNDWGFLFVSDLWPNPFSTAYNEAKTPKTRAKIACARIDWLIEKGI